MSAMSAVTRLIWLICRDVGWRMGGSRVVGRADDADVRRVTGRPGGHSRVLSFEFRHFQAERGMTNARPSGLFPHAPSGRFSNTARFPSLFSLLEAMIRRYATVLSLTLSLAAQAGAQQPSIEARLRGFDDDMARLLETWNVPGIGVGIVVKQQLVHARGYGYRDYCRMTLH